MSELQREVERAATELTHQREINVQREREWSEERARNLAQLAVHEDAQAAAQVAAQAAAQADLQLRAATAEHDQLRRDYDSLVNSTLWRGLQPVRATGERVPASWRRAVRRSLRATWWLVTLQFLRRFSEWRAAQSAARILREGAGNLQVVPGPVETPYDRWVRECDTLSDQDRTAIRAQIASLIAPPLISVVMPAYETPEPILRAAIASVRAQLYPHWELCIADDASPSPTVARVLAEVSAEEPRIRWVRRETNGHISAATNSALALATGEFIALMDHDDLLAEQALYRVAVEIVARPDLEMLYSDEDRIDDSGLRHTPYFKPDWDPDLILGQNMFSHLGVYRRSLVERLNGMREGFEGSQDHDLTLRAAAVTPPSLIHHIPAILYHWRLRGDESFSDTQFAACVASAKRSICEHLAVLPGAAGATVESSPLLSYWHRIRWPLPEIPPKVSVIVPTRDHAYLLERTALGVLEQTDYPDIELIIVDNGSTEPKALALLERLAVDERVRLLRSVGPFNYSALNNLAVRQASGTILLLLNNDVGVIEPGWLRELVSHVLRPGIGAAGAKLLYPDGRVQHGGVILGVGGVANHFGHGQPKDDPGYFGHLCLARSVSGVTGACLAIRKSLYERLGGLDEVNLKVAFNDVDLCLRIREAGLRIIWTPFAELFHYESASRGSDLTPDKIDRFRGEVEYMHARWGGQLQEDPYFNVNLCLLRGNYAPAIPPRSRQQWEAMTATQPAAATPR